MLLALAVPHAQAASVTLGGILGGKALLVVDGQRRVLAAGEVSPEGVKVLEVGRDVVAVELDGQRRELRIGGGAVGGNLTAPVVAEVRIPAGDGGHYDITGLINGQPANMVVDSGATHVSMTAAVAKRLNIPYLVKGEKGYSMTANGPVVAYRVLLDSVKVGAIELRNVEGSVRESSDSSPILLGMSFLGRLHMEQQSSVLVLRKQ